MLGVQDQVEIHQARRVGARRLTLEQVQKGGGVAEVVAGLYGFEPLADSVVGGDDGGHLRGEADTFSQHPVWRLVIHGCVHGAERRGRCAQHLHRVCVPDRADDVEHRLRQGSCRLEFGVETFELVRCRQRAVQQQVGRFLECRVLREVVNGVTPVA